MKISSTMNLDDIAELMGNSAEPHEAVAMRDALVEHHDGEDTTDIDDAEWLTILDMIVA